MNKNLVIIYALIMLECRLSYEDASRIFKIDMETLKEILENVKRIRELYYPLNYLAYETERFTENKRGIWKAFLLVRRLINILKIQDKEERKQLLNAFIKDLNGPNVTFAITKKGNYSPEEKKQILKYRLKYAKTNYDLKNELNISHIAIKNWEARLPEGDELKMRLQVFRSYTISAYNEMHPNHKK